MVTQLPLDDFWAAYTRIKSPCRNNTKSNNSPSGNNNQMSNLMGSTSFWPIGRATSSRPCERVSEWGPILSLQGRCSTGREPPWTYTLDMYLKLNPYSFSVCFPQKKINLICLMYPFIHFEMINRMMTIAWLFVIPL